MKSSIRSVTATEMNQSYIFIFMKKFINFIIGCLCIFASSCEKEPNAALVMPTDIRILSSTDIYLANGCTHNLEFNVLPADATFKYNTDGACDISLERIGGGSSNITLSAVELISKEEGKYLASIKSKTDAADYTENLILKITAKNANGIEKKITSGLFTVSNTAKLPTFEFLQSVNPTTINQNYSFVLEDKGNYNIQSALITSPELIATFEGNSADLYVNGVKQVSGVTKNDFSQPVTYTMELDRTYSFTVSVLHSGLPIVFIETPNGKIIPNKHSDWLAGSKLTIYNSDWTVAFDGSMGIRGRGNSTWGYPKKPYAIKLDEKNEILGMPKHKRWVLLANWLDRTLLRNAASFDLASRSGLAYTPRGQFVEVFINGEHKGNYFLCEQIKVDKNRVNVDKFDEAVVDGGYIFELDEYYDEEFKFRSEKRNLPYMFKDPDEDISDEHFKFVQDYVNNLEASLYDEERFAAVEYSDYIDVDSFVDWWLVMELTGIWEPNHPKSSYMHKNSGGKLVMGPVWDFDWETYMPANSGKYRIATAIYYEQLLKSPYFISRVKERWEAQKEAFRGLPDFINEQADYIRNSEKLNYAIEDCVVTSNVNKDIELTFDQAVEKMIQGFNQKFQWLDNAISKM